MSMMCYVGAVSRSQITAFRARPDLASDYSEISGGDLLDRRLNEGLSRMPPKARADYEAARENLLARDPRLAEHQKQLDAARPSLAAIGPFESLLELTKLCDILNYLLTGHSDAADAPGNTLVSGTPLGRDIGYGPPRLHDPAQALAFRNFLRPLDANRLLARMDFARMAQLRIYPLSERLDEADKQSWRDDVAAAFPLLKAYVDRAADKGDGLLIWLA